MKQKLFKVHIRTYYFGNVDYFIYVLAENSDEALGFIYKDPKYYKDEDAEIIEIYEIAAETKGIV